MNKSPQKPGLLTAIRWLLYLPAAFVAAMIAGAIGHIITDIFDGAGWYVWMVSGAASAAAFFFTAFYIAPYANAFTKWSTITIVALLGTLSAAGALIGSEQKVSSFAGLVMVVFAVWTANQPISKLANASSSND